MEYDHWTHHPLFLFAFWTIAGALFGLSRGLKLTDFYEHQRKQILELYDDDRLKDLRDQKIGEIAAVRIGVCLVHIKRWAVRGSILGSVGAIIVVLDRNFGILSP